MKPGKMLSYLIFLTLCSSDIMAQTAVKMPVMEEVSFTSGDAVYSGTLTLPAGEGKYPLVILVSGMGPQNRDWAFTAKYKMAEILSDHFVSKGIAVYRYDDRGFGKSTGIPEGQMSFEDLAGDIQNAVGLFRKRTDISQIGLCGHSLGGILAVMMAAENKDIDFIITLSGAFRNGADIMKEQAATLKRWRTSAEMTDEEVVANGVKFTENLVRYAGNGEGDYEIRKTLTDLINYQISKMTPEKLAENLKTFRDKEDLFQKSFDEAYSFYTSAHQKSFVTYNAADDISKISCPVLIMFGELDKNVVVSSNLPPVIDGFKQSGISDLTIRIVPGADHGYSNSVLNKTGKMIPGTEEFMANWILSRTGTEISR